MLLQPLYHGLDFTGLFDLYHLTAFRNDALMKYRIADHLLYVRAALATCTMVTSLYCAIILPCILWLNVIAFGLFGFWLVCSRRRGLCNRTRRAFWK